MHDLGSMLKAALAVLLVGALAACGDDGSSIVASAPSPVPTDPPPEDLNPEITFFQLPSPQIERGQDLFIPAGTLVVSTPRGLQGPENAFRVEIRALSEGNAFASSAFFTAGDAGCATGDVVCTTGSVPITIGPDAELDDYIIEITVFDSINISASATQNFTIVESL